LRRVCWRIVNDFVVSAVLDWDSFRVMLTIAQEGSLSGAARVLDVNQATVGRKLQRAESALNAKLFHRMNNGLFPTEAGLVALSSAQRIQTSIGDLTQQLHSTGMSEGGKIRLSIQKNLLGPRFSENISSFCLQEPNVSFEVTTTNKRVSFDDRTIDVVIRADNYPSAGLWGYRLTRLTYCYAASKTFMKTWGQAMADSPQTVALPVIDWSVGKGDACTQLLRKKFPNATEVMASDTFECIVPMVTSGVGVGRIRKEKLQEHPDLINVLDCEEIGVTDLWVLTHQDYRDVPHIRKFMDHLRDSLDLPKGTPHLVS